MKQLSRLCIGLTVVIGLLVAISPLTSAAAVPPANPPAGSTLAVRITQRKKERAVQVPAEDQKRLGDRCASAQVKIHQVYQSATTVISNHNKAYKKVDAKVWVTIGGLKLASRDTFELEKQHSSLIDRINDFQTTGVNYLQTLDDLQLINCQSDVIGFKALLETARLYQSQISTEATAITDTIVNGIKTNMALHVSEMEPNLDGGSKQ